MAARVVEVHKFPGRGQRPTPVADMPTLEELMRILQSKPAVNPRKRRRAPGDPEYVYTASCPAYSRVKIGTWRGALDGLRSRYVAFYGADLELETWRCDDSRDLEGELRAHVREFHITQELYKKDAVDAIRTFLDARCNSDE